MIRKIQLTILAGIGAGLAGCSGGGGGGSSETVAEVNGENITMEKFHRFLELKPTVTVATGTGGATSAQVIETLAFQAYQDLLRQKILMQIAKDEGLAPSDKDLEAELAFQKKINPNFVKQLQERGLTMGEIKESLAVDIARERLICKGVTKTTEDAKKYVREHPEEFKEPATVDMLWAVARTDATKAKIDAELRSGQGFAVVATRFSELPNASKDPRFPQRIVDQLPPEIKKIVSTTKDKQSSAWLRLSDGWAKFYVDGRTAAKPIEMDDTKYERVRRDLAMREGLQANDLDSRLLEKLKASKIEVKYQLLEEPWKRAMDRMKEQSKVEGSTAGTGSSPSTPSSGTGLIDPAPTGK